MSVDAPVRTRTGLRWGSAALIVGLAVGLPVLLTAAAGAMGLPRNDDWSYSDLLWRWQETGELRLGGWESMTLVGQLLPALPLAAAWPRHIASLQLFTIGVGAVGALAAYGTLRRFVAEGRALLAVAITLLGPLYVPLAASFMTDVPAFAAQAVCTWLGARALEASGRRATAWFVGAIAVGCYGVTIREYAVVAPVAVLAVFAARAYGRGDRRALTASACAGVAAAVFVAAFVAWRRTWHASLSLDPSAPNSVGDAAGSLGRSALFTVVTLAFLVLPTFAFAPLRDLARAATRTRAGVVAVLSASIVLVAGAIAAWEWSPPLLGPYLDQRGALGNDILPGDRALLVPAPLLFALLLVTLLAAVALVAVLVLTATQFEPGGSWRARCKSLDARALAWAFVVLTIGSVMAAGFVDLPIFDRYVLPAVPFAAGLVLAWHPAATVTRPLPTGAARWVAVAGFAALGLIWSIDAARFDATRWQAGERAVQLGYPADRVDAGFEWRNVHRLGGHPPMSPSQRDLDACVRLSGPSADLGPGWQPLFTVRYWHGLSGEETLTAWATDAPGCPPLP